MTDTEFEAVLNSGSSSSDMFLVCVHGVTISGSGNPIDIDEEYLKILGDSSDPPTLVEVLIDNNVGSGDIEFEYVKIHGDNQTDASVALDAALIIVENNKVTLNHAEVKGLANTEAAIRGPDTSGGMLIMNSVDASAVGTHYNATALYIDASSITVTATDSSFSSQSSSSDVLYYRASGTLTVSDSSVTHSGGTNEGCAWAYNFTTINFENSTCTSSGKGIVSNVNSTITIEDSEFTTAEEAIYDDNFASAGNTFNYKDSTFRRNGGSADKGAIRVISDNNNECTHNDTSTGSGNLFCNVSGSSASFDEIVDSLSMLYLGTFDPNSTQNGSNTSISTCP